MISVNGGVAEWLNAPVLKTDVGESLPWVRIPPPPPYFLKKLYKTDIKRVRLFFAPTLAPTILGFKPNIRQQMCHQPSKSYTASF